MAGVVVAFAISLAWAVIAPKTPIARLVADDPGDDPLKIHTDPTPPVGGVGVLLGLLTGLAVEGLLDRWVAGGLVLAFALGLLDDLKGVPPRVRLVAEAAIGALVAVPFAERGWPFVILMVLGCVAVINAVNLFDGIDGLVGATAAITAVGLSLVNGDATGLVLAATLAGFVIRNWHPAALFLGDNGSYVVGAAIIVGASAGSSPSIPAVLLGLGLTGLIGLDLLVTVLRRWIAKKPLFLGDRSHIYDQMVDRGLTVPQTVIALAAAQVWFVGIGVLVGQTAGEGVALVVLLGLAGLALGGLWPLGFIRAGQNG